ncbi:YkvA family protein [Algivirga pacifica]|uniref:DUF1232 domain-containing protein n=1 Tax=Algivirga pacifica TaxID=1162670 RepID=A0ABP9D9X9_9BACT
MNNNNYPNESYWLKLKKYAKKAGLKLVYVSLVLYNLLKDSTAPWIVKALVGFAITYFVIPFDLLPDFLLQLGFADDLGMMTLIFELIRPYVQQGHIVEAIKVTRELFGADVDLAPVQDMFVVEEPEQEEVVESIND